MSGAHATALRAPGLEGRLYSGALLGVRSPTRFRLPFTPADLFASAGARASLDLPATYSGFVYILEGSVRLGGTLALAGQVAWLRPGLGGLDVASDEGARFVLYAGEPIREPLVHRGPFVAGSAEQLAAYYQQYRAGRFPGIGEVGRRQREAR